MSETQRITVTSGAGSDLVGQGVDVTTANRQNVSTVVAQGTNNKALNVDWPANKLEALFIMVTVDSTLYVNAPSGGSPTDTLPLKANKPAVWYKDSGLPNPITGTAGAVTELYLTVPAGPADCTVTVRASIDI